MKNVNIQQNAKQDISRMMRHYKELKDLGCGMILAAQKADACCLRMASIPLILECVTHRRLCNSSACSNVRRCNVAVKFPRSVLCGIGPSFLAGCFHVGCAGEFRGDVVINSTKVDLPREVHDVTSGKGATC